MTLAEWIGAFVGIAGVIISFLVWLDSRKKLKKATSRIQNYYHKDDRLHILLAHLHILDAEETIELMNKLRVIIDEKNGRYKEATLLLEYLKNKHDID